jgi:hypothetical protein
MSHVLRGVTVFGHANIRDQRGHLPKEVKRFPKKDDVAMLAVISLGYDSRKRSRSAKPEPNGPQFQERG